MTKIVDKNGNEFELVPSQVEPDGTFTLRPIKPIEPEEEVENCQLHFYNLENDFMKSIYDLTPSEAEAVAKCLEAVMNTILNGEYLELESDKAIYVAGQLIQKRKGKV